LAGGERQDRCRWGISFPRREVPHESLSAQVARKLLNFIEENGLVPGELLLSRALGQTRRPRSWSPGCGAFLGARLRFVADVFAESRKKRTYYG